MEKGRGTIQKRADGVWFLRLPKNVCEDTHFPFEPKEPVRVIFAENTLEINKFPARVDCKFCTANGAKLVRTNADGTGHYLCEKCGEEFDE